MESILLCYNPPNCFIRYLLYLSDCHFSFRYHNIKLKNLQVIDAHKYPQFSSVKRIFIRGSVFRYVVLAKKDVDTTLLQDACRRESLKASTAMNANTAGASQ